MEHRSWETDGGKDLKNFMDLRHFGFVGRDKQGRPNVFVRVANFIPALVDFESIYKGAYELS